MPHYLNFDEVAEQIKTAAEKTVSSGLNLSSKFSTSAHAVYAVDYCQEKVFIKKNKFDQESFSKWEGGFNALAQLFISPNLCPNQILIKEDRKIFGLASVNMSYVARSREGEQAKFFYLKNSANKTIFCPEVAENKETPIYFFNQFPPEFFAELRKQEKKGECIFDMASLASVLCTSFTLEEDDLHKGNFGFYIVEKQGKKNIVFFKIDNDLMLANSIMSHCQARFANWLYTSSSFAITAHDLENFPNIADSQNHYWPTSKRFFAPLNDPKTYKDDEEIKAFANLAGDKNFQRAKWREFYKHVLIPPASIEARLNTIFDKKDPEDREQIVLIQQAVIARQARLRAVLFSLPKFRKYIKCLKKNERVALRKEIVHFNGDHFLLAQKPEQNSLEEDLQQQFLKKTNKRLVKKMRKDKALCQLLPDEGGFRAGDTPLHAAIRLGDFRYKDTWDDFKQFYNTANNSGQTPLDVAIFCASRVPQKTANLSKDYLAIIYYFLTRNVSKPNFDYSLIKERGIPCPYIRRTRRAKGAKEFQRILIKLRRDERYPSLKMKKNITICCLWVFIEEMQARHQAGYALKQLQQIKDNLNGPDLKFISQLRSRLWIVRKFRGLYGNTQTKKVMDGLLTREINRLKRQLAATDNHTPNTRGLGFYGTIQKGGKILINSTKKFKI